MRTSAKFLLLAELLPGLKAEGSRPLLFSQWTSVLDLMEWLLQAPPPPPPPGSPALPITAHQPHTSAAAHVGLKPLLTRGCVL